MKRGDIVELREGLHGLFHPENLAVFLERRRRDGSWVLVLLTVRGRVEVRPENVKGKWKASSFAHQEPEEELVRRLSESIRERGAPSSPSRIEIEERSLWRLLPQPPLTLSVEEIVRELRKKGVSSSPQEIRRVLESSLEPGVGYFVKKGPDSWSWISKSEYQEVLREIEGLRSLRKKIVRIVEVPRKDGKGVRWVPVGVPLSEAPLTEEDRSRLSRLAEYIERFIVEDGEPQGVGIGTSVVREIDGFRLSTFVKELAWDWTQAQGWTHSSVFAEFLLGTGLRTQEEIVRTIVQRVLRREKDFEWETPKAVSQAADRAVVGVPVLPQGRRDLRNLESYTIDPKDARDHDDAVGVLPLPEGFRLFVHIADVSEYVPLGSLLDRHARRRATSLYLPTGVAPMLPPALSEGACSLKEGEERLAVTVEVDLDPEGSILREDVYESLVCVRKNLTYEEVDELLRRGETPFTLFQRASEAILSRRRGLFLETRERKISFGSHEIITTLREGTPSTRMIEAFMVLANEVVARWLTRYGIPLPYRCHPIPDRVAVEKFNLQMRTMGEPIEITLPSFEGRVPLLKAPPEEARIEELLRTGRIELGAGSSGSLEEVEEQRELPFVGLSTLSKEEREELLRPFREALTTIHSTTDERRREVLLLKFLQSMGRAIYSSTNWGHFGLGSPEYTHFTSPIRRYPDLVVHRQLKALLRGDPPPHSREEVEEISEHSSKQSERADEIEREITRVCLVLSSRGESFRGALSGIVSGVSRGGLFLLLEGGLEAKVPLSELGRGIFEVDEAESVLERLPPPEEIQGSKRRWALGDRILVYVRGREYVEGRIVASPSPPTPPLSDIPVPDELD